MSHHRLYLAELAWKRKIFNRTILNISKYFKIFLIFLTSELWWTLTGVLVDFVPTGPSVLAHVVGTVVNIGGAVLTDKPCIKIF